MKLTVVISDSIAYLSAAFIGHKFGSMALSAWRAPKQVLGPAIVVMKHPVELVE